MQCEKAVIRLSTANNQISKAVSRKLGVRLPFSFVVMSRAQTIGDMWYQFVELGRNVKICDDLLTTLKASKGHENYF